MRVLVVDDDSEQRELRCLLLERHGFEPLQAASRPEARKLTEDEHPDAAIIDLGLPAVRDGLMLIKELKSLNSEMHIIVLTGSPRRSVEPDVSALEVDELFVKPAPTSRIIAKLRSYSEMKQQSLTELA